MEPDDELVAHRARSSPSGRACRRRRRAGASPRRRRRSLEIAFDGVRPRTAGSASALISASVAAGAGHPDQQAHDRRPEQRSSRVDVHGGQHRRIQAESGGYRAAWRGQRHERPRGRRGRARPADQGRSRASAAGAPGGRARHGAPPRARVPPAAARPRSGQDEWARSLRARRSRRRSAGTTPVAARRRVRAAPGSRCPMARLTSGTVRSSAAVSGALGVSSPGGRTNSSPWEPSVSTAELLAWRMGWQDEAQLGGALRDETARARAGLGDGDAHGERRMGSPQPAGELGERVDGKRGERGDLERPRAQLRDLADGAARVLEREQRLARGPDQRAPRVGQRESAPDLVEELCAELVVRTRAAPARARAARHAGALPPP